MNNVLAKDLRVTNSPKKDYIVDCPWCKKGALVSDWDNSKLNSVKFFLENRHKLPYASDRDVKVSKNIISVHARFDYDKESYVCPNCDASVDIEDFSVQYLSNLVYSQIKNKMSKDL